MLSPTHLSLSLYVPAAKEDFPKHSLTPIMRAKKLENLQICLKFLQERKVVIHSVQAEGM